MKRIDRRALYRGRPLLHVLGSRESEIRRLTRLPEPLLEAREAVYEQLMDQPPAAQERQQ